MWTSTSSPAAKTPRPARADAADRETLARDDPLTTPRLASQSPRRPLGSARPWRPSPGEMMKRTVIGAAAALASMAVLAAAMVPLRAHLSVATTALVLVVPVVIGVAAGGFTAGAISVLA